jgi:hypothetical protein
MRLLTGAIVLALGMIVGVAGGYWYAASERPEHCNEIFVTIPSCRLVFSKPIHTTAPLRPSNRGISFTSSDMFASESN